MDAPRLSSACDSHTVASHNVILPLDWQCDPEMLCYMLVATATRRLQKQTKEEQKEGEQERAANSGRVI